MPEEHTEFAFSFGSTCFGLEGAELAGAAEMGRRTLTVILSVTITPDDCSDVPSIGSGVMCTDPIEEPGAGGENSSSAGAVNGAPMRVVYARMVAKKSF